MPSPTSWLAVRLAAVLVQVAMSACFPVLPTRFMVLEASQGEGAVEFTSAELEDRCPSGILVLGISIQRDGCERDCKQWQLTRRGTADPTDELTPFPMRYGQEIPDSTVIQHPKALAPGVYTVGASMGCFIDGELLGERVFGRFEIPVGGGAIRNILASREP